MLDACEGDAVTANQFHSDVVIKVTVESVLLHTDNINCLNIIIISQLDPYLFP